MALTARREWSLEMVQPNQASMQRTITEIIVAPHLVLDSVCSTKLEGLQQGPHRVVLVCQHRAMKSYHHR